MLLLHLPPPFLNAHTQGGIGPAGPVGQPGNPGLAGAGGQQGDRGVQGGKVSFPTPYTTVM